MRTGDFILLSVVTFGLYPLMWLYRNLHVINNITRSKITSDSFVVWIAVCAGMNTLIITMNDLSLMPLSWIFSGITAIMYTVWGFKARKVLQDYARNEFQFELKIKTIYLLLFPVPYINYCINDLPEAFEKHKTLSAQATKTMDC